MELFSPFYFSFLSFFLCTHSVCGSVVHFYFNFNFNYFFYTFGCTPFEINSTKKASKGSKHSINQLLFASFLLLSFLSFLSFLKIPSL